MKKSRVGEIKPPVRCGRCRACKELDKLKPLFMPNPPFTHADDKMVFLWNREVEEHPCEAWKEGSFA